LSSAVRRNYDKWFVFVEIIVKVNCSIFDTWGAGIDIINYTLIISLLIPPVILKVGPNFP